MQKEKSMNTHRGRPIDYLRAAVEDVCFELECIPLSKYESMTNLEIDTLNDLLSSVNLRLEDLRVERES